MFKRVNSLHCAKQWETDYVIRAFTLQKSQKFVMRLLRPVKTTHGQTVLRPPYQLSLLDVDEILCHTEYLLLCVFISD